MLMVIDILTLFPKMFKGPFDESIIKRAQDKGLIKINIHDLRNWGLTDRKTVDDRPYGGGVGMILMVEPIDNALKDIKRGTNSKVILLCPQGKRFNQEKARELTKLEQLILISGHYEGFDERIRQHLVDEEISIGDYVLTGGELPAMVVAETVARLIPGVLSKEEATQSESFSENLLEYPQYTRPEKYKDWEVPPILLSGDHKKIEEWRKDESFKRTLSRRPDLTSKA